MNYYSIKFIVTVCLFVSVLSCSEQSTDIELCPVIVDSVSIIDTMETGGETYYLVYRVSGWNDKTEILELYNLKPVFDNCSRSNIEPLYADSLETAQTISHVYLNTNKNFLELIYVEGEPEKLHNASLKLEVK